MIRVSDGRIAGSRYWSQTFADREARLLWPRVGALTLPGIDPGDAWSWTLPEGVDLHSWLGPARADWVAASLARRPVMTSVSARLPCNWKVAVDAHSEALHVPWAHAEVAGHVDAASASFEPLGRHGRIRVPTAAGITEQLFVFPNLHVNLSAGSEVQVLRHRPDGPRACWVDMQILGPVSASPSRTAHRTVSPDDPAFGPVTGADIALLPDVQAGVEARAFPGVRLSPAEPGVAHFHAALDDALGITPG